VQLGDIINRRRCPDHLQTHRDDGIVATSGEKVSKGLQIDRDASAF
jgi:hypothetical protein